MERCKFFLSSLLYVEIKYSYLYFSRVEMCYSLPENPEIKGTKFSCDHLKYLEGLGELVFFD